MMCSYRLAKRSTRSTQNSKGIPPMIGPSNYRPGMTVSEAVGGYIADGETAEDAEMLASVLLEPSPNRPLM